MARPSSPTPPATRRLPASERRAVIADAAAGLFAEHGYVATRMEDIAVAAGVTKPVLYRHFPSKKALHMALLERERDALAAAPLDVYLGSDAPFSERLPPMIEAWFAYVEEHAYAARLLFRDTTGDPEVEALHRDLQARQRAADVAIMRESLPGLPPEQLEPLGEVVRCTLTGLALWWLDHPEVERATLVATAMRVFDGLLATAGPSGVSSQPD